jgi:hypothetical protein
VTLKTLVTGVAAAAVVGGAAAGVTSIAPGALSFAPAVQPVVFGAPFPLTTPCAVTADDLRGVLDGLADPNVQFRPGKIGLVDGGIGMIEGRTADRLLKNAYATGALPVFFDVAPPVCDGNTATTTVSAKGQTQSITFVNNGGWKLSRGSATAVLSAFSG